jgi:hypothetical protein
MCASRRRIAFSVVVGGTARAMPAATSVQRPPKRNTHATPFLPRYKFSWWPGISGTYDPAYVAENAGGGALSASRKMALAMREI